MGGIAARFNEIKEQQYQSNIREPLARGYERNYVWPQEIKHETHTFGY